MSAGRAAPWRSKPSQELQALVTQLSQPSGAGNSSNSSWYVLQRPGPSSFVVGQDSSGDKFKVALGNQPTCSCRPTAAHSQEPCVHLLFIMLRVMRLSVDNPLMWQSALTDRELQELLDGRTSTTSRGAAGRLAGRRSSSCSSGKPDSSVQRRTIEQDEPCPICYESLSNVAPGWLVWCSHSCGKSIHGRCMRVWSDHQTKTLQQELSCPLCRCPWGKLDWSPPATPAAAGAAASGKAAAHAKNCHKGVTCSGCNQSPIEGIRYRCLECAAVNLCRACFTAGQHLQHSFVCCATPSAPEQHAERPMHFGLQCSGLAQVSAAAGAAVQYSRNSTGSRVTSSAALSLQNSNSSSCRQTAGNSRGSKTSSEGSSALSQAAEWPPQLGCGLQGSSLRQGAQLEAAEHGTCTARASGSSSSSRTGSSGSNRTGSSSSGSSRTGSAGDTGSRNSSRHGDCSSHGHLDRAEGGSDVSPTMAAGAAAAARAAAAAAVSTPAQQADQGNATADTLNILRAGGQLSSTSSVISNSSSSAGSTHSSDRGQLTHTDCASSTDSGACVKNNSKFEPESRSRGSAPMSRPAGKHGQLHPGCKPPAALQHDFAALMLSGHTAPGHRAPAAAAAALQGSYPDTEATGTAAIARAAAAGTVLVTATAAGRHYGGCSGRAVPAQRAKKGFGSSCVLQAKPPAPKDGQQAAQSAQQLLTVCGLAAAALHDAQH